jgi:[ribosomal protein S5]-alanine N-acetyltransferase
MRLETPRLVLREFEEADAPACNEYERDPEVVRYQSNGERTLEESLAYLRKSLATVAESPRRTFDLAVTLKDTGALIGRAGINVTEVNDRGAAIWYVIHRAHWGKGYIPEAMRAMVDFGFGELGLHRVYADLDPQNHASKRVCEKLGMRLEAHFVENAFIKGEWVDSLIYGILDREWRARGA